MPVTLYAGDNSCLNLPRRKIIFSHVQALDGSDFAPPVRRVRGVRGGSKTIRPKTVFSVMPAPRLSACLFAVLCLTLRAGDFSAYRVGDTADTDITTPVALDVVDSAATAALQSSRAVQTPAVFRSLPDATNAMAREFLVAFAGTRTNFLTAFAAGFPFRTADAAVVSSADFGRLVTAFNVKNKNFPITGKLAAEWARGGVGAADQQKILHALLRAAGRLVRPDKLPAHFVIGETIRLVPVTDVDQKLSLDEVQRGRLAPAAGITTVSDAQSIFYNEFSADEQPFARALSAFVRPDCFPDAPFTELVRGIAVGQLTVSDHFDAGETIVHRDEVIDVKTKAVLEALNEKLPASTGGLSAIGHAQPLPPKPESQALAPSSALATPVRVLKDGVHDGWLIIVLAGISAAGLLVAWRQVLLGRKNSSVSSPVSQAPPQASTSANDELAQGLRDAVMRELAMQRRELLLAQQAASDEIAALVRRLDELQMPLQEREQAYEARIKALEEELALRTEENRELLKLKIEMVRRQLDTERAGSRVHFN